MSESSFSLPDRSPQVFAATTVTLVIAGLFVIGRVISRGFIVRQLRWDDYWIVAAFLIAFGLSFAILFGTTKGLGKGDTEIEDSWRPALRRCEYVFSVLYNPALMATKTSILIFYLSLAKDTQKFMRIASLITLAVVLVAGIVLTFLNIFQCNPVGSVLSVEADQSATCIPLVTLYLVSAPVNIITDLAILVLPIPVLTGMRLPQKQKSILVATFTLGIFVTIVDVIRIFYLQEASFQQENSSYASTLTPGLNDNSPSYRLGDASNFAWTASLSLMWSAVEVNVGIICACVPTLKPLIKRILPSWIEHATGSFTRSNLHTVSDTAADMAGQPHERLASEAPTSPTHFGPLSPPRGSDIEQEMGMMDFLTTAVDMEPTAVTSGDADHEMTFEEILNAGPALGRSDTVRTLATTTDTVYFGFVNMRRPKSMMKTRGKDSWKYCIMVTILFFLWGFSYGLLNTLNSKISQIIGTTLMSQTIGLQSAYFGAYFFGPLLCGRYVLKTEHGFKSTFITGLSIYGIGIIMFWPSAVLYSYAGFVISNFVVGFGLSILETAANPFLALCGAPRYMEVRLLLAQGIQGVGSVVSPLLAEKALFTTVQGRASLIDVQWTYLAVALFCVVLALFFYYMPLPEASDEDLDIQMMQETPFSFTPQNSNTNISTPRLRSNRIGKVRAVYLTLGLGVAAQYLYVADQESVSQFLQYLLTPSLNVNIADSAASLDFLSQLLIAHTAFAVGRFAAAGLCMIMKPRKVYLGFWTLSLVFAALAFALSNVAANTLSTIVVLFFFFQGPLWPMTFSLTLRGMGRRTKDAAAFLTSGASGGAALPWVMYAIKTSGSGNRVQYSYSVVVALISVGLVYPVYLNFFPEAREQVDTRREEDWSTSQSHGVDDGNTTPIRRLSEKLTIIFQKMKISGDGGSASSDGPVVEHDEMSGNIEIQPGSRGSDGTYQEFEK